MRKTRTPGELRPWGSARSIIDVDDLSVEELDFIIKKACDIMENPYEYSDICKGKKLATLFYEPSTRTRLSFEAAMIELGGNVLGFSSASSASVSKGESVADTAKVISCYADIIAMRHPYEGAPLVAAVNSSIPLINAGDGGHAHPTQTLADFLTIYREHGRLDNLVIGLCGDLKYGRTVHSLIKAMSRYEGISFVFISPEELRIPDYIKTEVLRVNDIPFIEETSLENAIAKLDILYMTRIQRERFEDMDEYERLKDSYVLNSQKLASAKQNMSILHPLPRVNEISVEVDDDFRACYFKQALNGKFVRMALILKLLADTARGDFDSKYDGAVAENHKCHNLKCISQIEQELPQRFKIGLDGKMHCAYCDSIVSFETK